MTVDTIFDIASLTKPLGTTLAIMSLAERGRLQLDAPLGRYLREFRKTAFNQVTIRRMMTHTAGFPGIPPNKAVAKAFPRAARLLAQRDLDYAPGTGFQYSDEGYILLAEVVRRVSGQPLDQYLQQTVFRPLGLRDTSFRPPADRRARTAPTEWQNGVMLRGDVHDPRARLLGGVAGHAGMFSTAADISRIIRVLLRGGEVDGRRILKAETVRTMWSRTPPEDGSRALGWDISSQYARGMAPFFPAGSVGHTGFTGTSVWVDPASRAYVVLLTNRVHPSGGGAARIRELRTRVTAAVGAALFRPDPPAPLAATSGPAADGGDGDVAPNGMTAGRRGGPVRTGLDLMAEEGFARFRKQAIGLVTNQTGVDAQGRRAIDLFAAAPGLRLTAIFSPEHGLTGAVDADVPHGRDAATGRPVWSLYGPTRRPNADMLRDVSMLVFDIQDLGVRYYTYLTTLVLRDGGGRQARHSGGGAGPAQSHQRTCGRGSRDGRRSAVLHGAAPDPGPHRPHHRGVRAAGGRGAPAAGLADHHRDGRLAARDVVRRDVAALGQPVAQYPVADAGAALLRHRPAGEHQPLGGAGDRDAVRGDRRAVDRAGGTGRCHEPAAPARHPLRAGPVHAHGRQACPGGVQRPAIRRHRPERRAAGDGSAGPGA
jgi:CubicO group peptidase (beta-lactamase class C family)